MAAEAVVDFIGHDAKLQATLDGIGKSVQGLEGKFKGAFSVAANLFTAEKLIGFGKKIFEITGRTEEFGARIEDINKSFEKMAANIGGALLPALESIVPVLETIAGLFEKTTENGQRGWWAQTQRDLAVAFGGAEAGLEFDNPGGSDAVPTYRTEQQRKAEQARLEALWAGQSHTPMFGSPTDAATTGDFTDVFRQPFGGPIGRAALANVPSLEAFDNDWNGQESLITKERKFFEKGFKSLFEGIGSATGNQELSGTLLKGIVAQVASATGTAAGSGSGFQAGFEDTASLFKRIQSGAASTPADKTAQATETTAKNTEKIKTGIDSVVKATEGMFESLKSGITALATYQ